MKEIWKQIEMVHGLLEDELSKKIYEGKVNSIFLDEQDKTIDLLYNTYTASRLLALEKFIGDREDASCVIAGAGCYGEKTYRALTHAGYKVDCFIDNDEKNNIILNTEYQFCLLQRFVEENAME